MSSLHNRMYNHEVPPPGNAWEKIASALDESELQSNYPHRLYSMEIIPPAGAWEKISSSFVSGKEKAVAPVRRLSPILRYAAAAMLVGAVAFGIIRFAVNNDNNETYSLNAGNPGDTNTNKNTPKTTDTGNALVTQDIEVRQSNTSRIAERESIKPGPVERKVPGRAVNTTYTQPLQIDPELSQSIYAYADHVPDIADRYVMLMTPDGNLIRMSKKWSNLLCCVSGEEQDPTCKSQIKKWQEKIASSSLAPSPGNFMDILGLVSSLNDSNGL